jgi:hypothetical protein
MALVALSIARLASRRGLEKVAERATSTPVQKLTFGGWFRRRGCTSGFRDSGGGGSRGYATFAMSCGNGDFGRLGHGGEGQGDAGLGLSSEAFRRVAGIPQVCAYRKKACQV